MERLLIAYDGSGCADAALEELPRCGLPEQLNTMILSVAEVWPPPDWPSAATEPAVRLPVAMQVAREAAVQAIERATHQVAERAAQRLRALFPKWSIQPEVIACSPAWGIIEQAEQWGADLVVVGSHSRSLMGRFFLGSVSHKVAIEAPCSVHIARPHPQSQSHRILLAVDGSPDSLVSVRAVAARIWPPSTVAQIIGVLDSRMLTMAAQPDPVTERWLRATDSVGKEWVERALEACAQQLRSSGLAVDTCLLEGDPKYLVLKHAEAWQADCIFLGAHGLHHGPERTLGTFASAVAVRAHCSVEIVREQPSSDAPSRAE